MLKYSLVIDDYYYENSLCDRFQKAKDIGYDGVEIISGYKELDKEKIRKALSDANMKLFSITPNSSLHNALRFQYDQISPEIEKTIVFAKEVGAECVTLSFGKIPVTQNNAFDLIRNNLEKVVELAEKYEMLISVDPISQTYEDRGLYINSSSRGADIVKEINSDYLKMMYDFYAIFKLEGRNIIDISMVVDCVSNVCFSAIPTKDDCSNGLFYNSAKLALQKLNDSNNDFIASLKYTNFALGLQLPDVSLCIMKEMIRGVGE